MPNYNPSPKAQFQAEKEIVSSHHRLIENHQFETSIHYALLHYQSLLAKGAGTFNDAAANHFKMTGALEFVQELRLLAEPQQKPTPVPDRDNLTH